MFIPSINIYDVSKNLINMIGDTSGLIFDKFSDEKINELSNKYPKYYNPEIVKEYNEIEETFSKLLPDFTSLNNEDKFLFSNSEFTKYIPLPFWFGGPNFTDLSSNNIDDIDN
jgi:hypothetical protein